MEDKDKQSEQAREQLAKELVRTKISLECADNTIKKQQENIKELEQENTKLQSMITKIKAIAEKECKDCLNKRNDSCWICPYYPIIDLITKAEEE